MTALLPIAEHVNVRVPNSTAHAEAIRAARSALRGLAVFPRIEQVVGAERAEGMTLLVLAISERLVPARRDELLAATHDHVLAGELAGLRAQLDALWTITSEA